MCLGIRIWRYQALELLPVVLHKHEWICRAAADERDT